MGDVMPEGTAKEGWRSRLRALLGRAAEAPFPRGELEALLYEADLSACLIERLLSAGKEAAGGGREAILAAFQGEVETLLRSVPPPSRWPPAPAAVLLLGVNGCGKTSTAGKLAWRFRAEGMRVVLAAADTFRAGAIEQLEIWGARAGAEVVAREAGADPAAVVFEAWQQAVARGAVLIADTAGRLQTKAPLMEELRKLVRVLGRDGRGAPHESFLVLDATVGQNSLVQAREFQKAVPLTGLIVTKLDGTARGGSALVSSLELKLPIRYLGVGERESDLIPFRAGEFARDLFQT